MHNPSFLRNGILDYISVSIRVLQRDLSYQVSTVKKSMATGFQFGKPALNWDANDTYQEYQRFKYYVEFTFDKKKDRAGWMGIWIVQQGRIMNKTFTWEGVQ